MKRLLFLFATCVIIWPLAAQEPTTDIWGDESMEDVFFGGSKQDTVIAPPEESPASQPAQKTPVVRAHTASTPSAQVQTRQRSQTTTKRKSSSSHFRQGYYSDMPRIGLHIGYGLQTMVGSKKSISYDDIKMKRQPNFAWRVGTQAMVPLMFGAWMFDAAIGSRGYNATYTEGDIHLKEEWQLFNFQIAPFNYAYNIQAGSAVVTPYLGLFLSFDFAGFYKRKITAPGYSDTWKASIWEKSKQDAEYITYYYNKKHKPRLVHEFIDVGIEVGLNVYFRENWFMGCMFQAGFLDDTKEEYRKMRWGKNSSSGTNITFMLTTGYMF